MGVVQILVARSTCNCSKKAQSIAVMEASYSIDSAVRGYHVYSEVWKPVNAEVLQCERQTSNRFDPFAVEVKKNSVVVGHVPRRFSAICSLFLRRGGSITCTVNGSRRYSSDLPQGGLEIPCVLTFSGEQTRIDKVKKAITIVAEQLSENRGSNGDSETKGYTCDDKPAQSVGHSDDSDKSGADSQIKGSIKSAESLIQIDDDSTDSGSITAVNVLWVRCGQITSGMAEKEVIMCAW